jgi:hypothetical protein
MIVGFAEPVRSDSGDEAGLRAPAKEEGAR